MLKSSEPPTMIFSRPRLLRREARASAPSSAPQPAAPIRNPRLCGPPFKTLRTKTGIRVMYDNADQADPGDEGDDQADGPQTEGIGEPFAQFGPETCYFPGGCFAGANLMASRAKITAR